jgi:hypothetical protein
MLCTSLSILTSPPPHPHTTIPKAAPPGVSISDICEGKHSYKTFQPIHTVFPWDNPKHSKPILGKTGGSHWSIRRALMQATASLSQQGQGQIRSERQPVPLLRNQQPQFSSWNKGNPTLYTLWHYTSEYLITLRSYISSSLVCMGVCPYPLQHSFFNMIWPLQR